MLFNAKKANLFSWPSTARQRPTLAGGDPQLPSALESLTSEFGMCSGVTFPPSPPDLYFIWDVFPENRMGEKTVNREWLCFLTLRIVQLQRL